MRETILEILETISQRRLALMVGAAYQTVSDWATGKHRPSPQFCDRIFEVYAYLDLFSQPAARAVLGQFRECGFRISEIAQIIGVNRFTIHRWLRGGAIKKCFIPRIIDANDRFGVSEHITICSAVATLREEVAPKKLAAIVGVSECTVSRWFSGTRIPYKNREIIMDIASEIIELNKMEIA
jgi:transcriptional regulator with XRE-family HTH domain